MIVAYLSNLDAPHRPDVVVGGTQQAAHGLQCLDVGPRWEQGLMPQQLPHDAPAGPHVDGFSVGLQAQQDLRRPAAGCWSCRGVVLCMCGRAATTGPHVDDFNAGVRVQLYLRSLASECCSCMASKAAEFCCRDHQLCQAEVAACLHNVTTTSSPGFGRHGPISVRLPTCTRA